MASPSAPTEPDPSHRAAGAAIEDAVAAALAARGWTVLARRVRVGRLELDLVAVDPGPPAALVIAEVRWRRSRAFGLPEETVDSRKIARLHRAAVALAVRGTLSDGTALPSLPLRLDVIGVEPGTEGRIRARHHRGIDAAGSRGPLW